MKRSSLLVLILALSFFQKAGAQIPAAYSARLQFVLDSVASTYNMKGVSAAVVVPGVGTWTGVYGESHAGVPINSSMLLGIGSNTKTFISSLILRMEEQSLISLSDTIGTWIQHPNVDGQITITQLLNHTSGIYNFTNSQAWQDSLFADITRVWIPDSIMQFIAAPDFAPGTGWNYSNSNYLILGLIIKQIMNQPLSTALRNNILTPAGLNNTFLYPEESVTATVPHVWTGAFNIPGYLEDADATYNYTHIGGFSMAWAAGAILSTAEDNALFWSKLIQGQIVSTTSLVKMKQTVTLSASTGYGLGIFRYKNFNGRTVYAHGGTNLGFINENLADSISNVGISVLTNQDSVSNNILRTKLVAALHKVTIAPPLSVGYLSAADHTVSVYPNPAKNKISITGMTDGKTSVLRVYDVTGRQVLSKEISNYRNIELPTLSNGWYTVKITEPGKGTYLPQLIHVIQ
jgi:D-alanyl-D-alanine carboxypeptidase